MGVNDSCGATVLREWVGPVRLVHDVGVAEDRRLADIRTSRWLGANTLCGVGGSATLDIS